MDARVISKLYEVDPDFRTLYGLLYKGLDSPDVHIDGDGSQRKKKSLAAGLLLGTTAESLAVARAGQNAFPGAGARVAGALKPLARASAKLPKIKLNPKAEFAVQATNMAVGLGAARELLKKPKAPVESTVSKALGARLKPLNPAPKLVPSLKAKKPVGLAQTPVAKARIPFRKPAEPMARFAGRERVVPAGRHAEGEHHAKHQAKPTRRQKIGRLVAASTLGTAAVGTEVEYRRQQRQAGYAYGKALTWTGEISKVDTDKRQVFGWCSLSKVDGKEVVDLQGDYVPLEEIEKSAYRYVVESRKGGDMHRRVSKGDEPLHTADLIESFVVTPEKLRGMGLAEDALPHGWWLGMHVNDDEQWAKVKSGERTAFSIHGVGSRKDITLPGGPHGS